MENEEIRDDYNRCGVKEILAQYMMNPYAEEIVLEHINELKETIKKSMEAMRKNLVYANFKDEIIMYEAFKESERVLSNAENDEG